MNFDPATAIFNQVDANGDNQIDRNEFSQWLSNQTSGSGFGAASGASSYEATSFSSDAGATGLVSGADAGAAGFFGSAAFAGTGVGTEAASFKSASSSSSSGSLAVQRYATDAQGNYIDSNPLVVRAAAAGCPGVYMQNVKVRLLQPPQLEPHGVCSIFVSQSHLFSESHHIGFYIATHCPTSAPTSTTCATSSGLTPSRSSSNNTTTTYYSSTTTT